MGTQPEWFVGDYEGASHYLKTGEFKVVVHHLFGDRVGWYLTVRELGIQGQSLSSMDVKEARREAVAHIRERLLSQLNSLPNEGAA